MFLRFHPFDMQPGSFRLLLFKGVFRCNGSQIMGKQDALTYSDFPIRYSFLWRTATAEIPLDQPLHISFAKEGCARLSGSDARQVRRPAGRDPRRGEADEERRRGRARRGVQHHPDLLERAVALA